MIVPGFGRVPNDAMIVGEAPGRNEASAGRPFVGRAGKELETYLSRHDLSIHHCYRTNVVKKYREGNPDPSTADIAKWTPVLISEIAKVQPKIVIAAGAFATRWFLGPDASMDLVHGLAHRSSRAPGAWVVPCFHPAAGLYDDDVRARIAYDYGVAARACHGDVAARPDDAWPSPLYEDADGAQLADYVSNAAVIAIDTEGTPSQPWSIQVSKEPGHALVLRTPAPDFGTGMDALRRFRGRVLMHNAMYDLEMCRSMGVHFRSVWDSMYAAYLLRTEPQGLKALSYRWCGMTMADYSETVGGSVKEARIDYLSRVIDGDWPKPEPRVVTKNDGTARLYQPQPVQQRATAILRDVVDADLNARWLKIDADVRAVVERDLGPWPEPSLGSIPLDRAVYYSGRDADATLRLYHTLEPEIARLDLGRIMDQGMAALPIFERMQANGMPGDRGRFEALHDDMTLAMERIQARISNRYYGGRPFNPASPSQVRSLMRRRGLRGKKRTKTGEVSTAKKSVEHLRHTDDAMADVIEWREHQKVRDSFCTPAIEALAGSTVVRCQIKPTRVHTRRLAASDPNLLAIPVRNELGRRVRECYVAPEGYVFGAWDLSQMEMRYMAHLSRDELLCRRFIAGADIHSETAAEIFGIPVEEVDPMEHRYPAKRAGFGIITNIQGQGLVDQLRMFGCKGWTVDSCNDLIEQWLRVYKGVGRFLEECKREVRHSGEVRDEWGMIRYLPGVWSVDRKTRAEAERAASSHKIQGGAQGILQQAMIEMAPVIDVYPDVDWLLQVHDEVILMFPEERWEELDVIVTDALTTTVTLSVPVEAEGHMSRTWGGLK